MFYYCLRCIKKITSKEDKKNKSELVNLDYKERMNELRPPELKIRKRRMRIYWYHKESNNNNEN